MAARPISTFDPPNTSLPSFTSIVLFSIAMPQLAADAMALGQHLPLSPPSKRKSPKPPPSGRARPLAAPPALTPAQHPLVQVSASIELRVMTKAKASTYRRLPKLSPSARRRKPQPSRVDEKGVKTSASRAHPRPQRRCKNAGSHGFFLGRGVAGLATKQGGSGGGGGGGGCGGEALGIATPNEVGPTRCRATPTLTSQPMRPSPLPLNACRQLVLAAPLGLGIWVVRRGTLEEEEAIAWRG